MKRLFSLSAMAAIILGACTPNAPERTEDETVQRLAMPLTKTFTAPARTAPIRSNIQMAQDFLDLSFALESGRELPIFTRFEGPVTIRVIGTIPSHMSQDLNQLLERLRDEAGIDITRVSANQAANITVQTLPREQLQKVLPKAACSLAPNVDNWNAFLRKRLFGTMKWTRLETREKVAVFLPSNESPQEIRDCLHEEIAQALGPLNDLYRLTDSVFNDDNFQSVLTGFDMLMLRTYYDPALRSGMSREDVAQRLPEILARLNPEGERSGVAISSATPEAWIQAIEMAIGRGATPEQRLDAAKQAVALATQYQLSDNRLAFSLFTRGRLSLAQDKSNAIEAFLASARIYAATPDTDIQRAHIALHLAAFGLSAGQYLDTLNLVNRHIRAASDRQNAILLATLLMIKAEALDGLGRSAEAQSVRLDSLGWARYGFGSEEDIRARLNEIAALGPEKVIE